jgi:hypothetical protein
MKQLPSKVLYWDDERSIGNSLIVVLKYGWRFKSGMPFNPKDETHVEGFDTIRDAKKAVSAAIKCECDECVENLAKVAA